MRPEYSQSMAAFQFGSYRADEISPGSLVVEINPYPIVSSVYTFSLRYFSLKSCAPSKLRVGQSLELSVVGPPGLLRRDPLN
jgi:hypothetical protein